MPPFSTKKAWVVESTDFLLLSFLTIRIERVEKRGHCHSAPQVIEAVSEAHFDSMASIMESHDEKQPNERGKEEKAKRKISNTNHVALPSASCFLLSFEK